MNNVYPIKSLKQVHVMKELMLDDGKYKEAFLLILGVNTGLRISDLLTLTYGEVLEGEFLVKERKTGKARRIVLNKAVMDMIDELDVGEAKDYIFKSESNRVKGRQQQPWHQNYVCNILKTYAEKAGIKANIGTHSLRKTFGYHVYKKTRDIGLVQKLLNHSSSATTLRYIGIDQEVMDETMKGLNIA